MNPVLPVVGVLRARATPFAVIGAAALAARGVSRATGDLGRLLSQPQADELVAEVEARLATLPGRCLRLWRRLRETPGA